MFDEFEVVSLKRPIRSLDAGAIGAIVMVYDSVPPAYEVEFADSNGVTLELLTLHDDDLSRVNK
jgi:hypothetical protein